jgi:arylsulfatase
MGVFERSGPSIRGVTNDRAVLIALALVAVLSGWVGCRAGPAPVARPDVYVLLVDTLRADHLGAYGYARGTSPRLDEFAASALVFSRVVAPAPWTLPSVGSLMTATYPSVHGLRTRTGERWLTTMRPGLTSLAQVLRDAGYRTVAVVTNPWMRDENGLLHGFDEQHLLTADTRAEQVNRTARALLENADARPTFLYLHYMDVHGPYAARPVNGTDVLGPVPPSGQRPLTQSELLSVPAYLRLRGASTLAAYVDAYDRGIASWDRAFGDWIAWLAGTERLDRAIVTVLSDHGEELLDHGGWNHGSTLYEEQVAVPWILRLPREAARGRREAVVSLIDVAPTILAVLQLPVPSTMEGRDAFDPSVAATPRTFFSETEVRLGGHPDPASRQRAVRRGSKKLIVGPRGQHCFDLQVDPSERASASDRHCERELLGELEAWTRKSGERAQALGQSAERALSPADAEHLRALGYID